MATTPLKIKAAKGKVDFAVITIRQDEYEAVLDRLPNRRTILGGDWNYEYATFRNKSGELIRVAVARTESQGHGAAQQLANDMFVDLNPKWIVLVGIAGGFPSDDFSLGDVVLASKVVDLSVTAAKKGGRTEYVAQGGPCHPDVETLLSWLPSQKSELTEWCIPSNLIQEKPKLVAPADHFDTRLYGNDDHKEDVANTLQMHFSATREPLFASAALATSNTLVKDTNVAGQFLAVSRDIEHVEMEAGGVYRVCHRKRLPLLCIRGISDIVGFNRAPEWTLFACHSAAAFFSAMLITLPRQAWGTSLGVLRDWPRKFRWIAIGFGWAMSGISYSTGVIKGTNLPSVEQLKQRVTKHSQRVLRFKISSDDRIEFEVETQLKIMTEDADVKLLLGPPGSGKTCLLAKVGVELAVTGYTVLAIKADMFPHDLSLDQWAKSEIGYDMTFFEIVQAVSAREELVVLIDQLDALASIVDQTSSRLNELISFIAKCKEISGVHVISSCRNVDFTYDARFKRLEAQTFQLDLPAWNQVAELLTKRGHNSEEISKSLREELRVMQHLDIYMRLQDSQSIDGGQNDENI